MRTRILFTLTLFVVTTFSLVRGDDWPQFRGPNGSATSTEDNLPTRWSTTKNIAWKVKLPGYGWSCPVIWGDKVFITTAVTDKQQKPSGGFDKGGFGKGGFDKGNFGKGGKGGFGKGGFGKGGFGPGGMKGRVPDTVYKWEIHCLSATDGKTLWKKVAAEKKPTTSVHSSNTYATETPVTDGNRVYAYFGAAGAFCYDLDGNFLWKANLGTYRVFAGHGTASSPVLADGKLIIQCDNDEKSFLVALDAKTGKEVWKTPREERTGWSTPLVWKNKERTEIVCVGGSHVRSYDPSTGKQLWQLAGTSGQVKASPVANDTVLFVGSGGGMGGIGFGPGGGFGGGRAGGFGGSGKPLFAVKAGSSGDISLTGKAESNASVAWKQTQAGPATPSLLLYQGYLYVLEDRGGILCCHDSKTGKQLYKERIPGARSFTSSPWAYGGNVFCLDDAGTTHVVKAGPEFEVIASNKLGEMAWSSPAAAHGSLFLRTVDHLYCIREAK